MAQRSTEPNLDLADLGHLPRSQLRDLWHKEVGEKPPGSFGRELLALGIAYDRQERRYGGFPAFSDGTDDRVYISPSIWKAMVPRSSNTPASSASKASSPSARAYAILDVIFREFCVGK